MGPLEAVPKTVRASATVLILIPARTISRAVPKIAVDPIVLTLAVRLHQGVARLDSDQDTKGRVKRPK